MIALNLHPNHCGEETMPKQPSAAQSAASKRNGAKGRGALVVRDETEVESERPKHGASFAKTFALPNELLTPSAIFFGGGRLGPHWVAWAWFPLRHVSDVVSRGDHTLPLSLLILSPDRPGKMRVLGKIF